MTQKYPLPVTAAMLAPANSRVGYPRYDTPADWYMGATGNDADVATATVAKEGAAGAADTVAVPTRRTQTDRANTMAPALQIVDDIGKDYGVYAGLTDRTGSIAPRAPYPDATSPPMVGAVTPSTGGVAGGTRITIIGQGFAGTTSVAIGGVAATSITIVDANTLTVTTPAKTAGSYDVVVTTTRGTNPTGTKFTYV